MMRHSPRTCLKGKQRVLVDGWLSPTPYFIILVSPQPTGWNTLADVKGVDMKSTNRPSLHTVSQSPADYIPSLASQYARSRTTRSPVPSGTHSARSSAPCPSCTLAA